jgi:hypothetical protein
VDKATNKRGSETNKCGDLKFGIIFVIPEIRLASRIVA